MTMITASAQRDLALTPLSADELAKKYKSAIDLVNSEAKVNRKFSVPVSVGQDDVGEFIKFFEDFGFKVLPIATKPSPLPQSVRNDTQGALVYRLVFWAEVTVARPANITPVDQITRGSVHNWLVSTKGLSVGQTLYWKDSGSALAGDFADNVKQGSITISSQGTGQIQRSVLAQAAEPIGPNPRTVLIELYLDAARTQLIAQSASVVIVSN